VAYWTVLLTVQLRPPCFLLTLRVSKQSYDCVRTAMPLKKLPLLTFTVFESTVLNRISVRPVLDPKIQAATLPLQIIPTITKTVR
jgi:hypothetical protein